MYPKPKWQLLPSQWKPEQPGVLAQLDGQFWAVSERNNDASVFSTAFKSDTECASRLKLCFLTWVHLKCINDTVSFYIFYEPYIAQMFSTFKIFRFFFDEISNVAIPYRGCSLTKLFERWFIWIHTDVRGKGEFGPSITCLSIIFTTWCLCSYSENLRGCHYSIAWTNCYFFIISR